MKVKWGKDTFKDVEANTDEDILVFKAQLYALTGVPPDRQKIVIKGTNLKSWANVSIKDVNTNFELDFLVIKFCFRGRRFC